MISLQQIKMQCKTKITFTLLNSIDDPTEIYPNYIFMEHKQMSCKYIQRDIYCYQLLNMKTIQ